jgi:two-component system sensor histidine kinase KdpD
MLVAARSLQASGVDVVIGVVDAQACYKTADLCKGLLSLGPQEFKDADAPGNAHAGGFDLDAALQRRPSLIIVDELAHTNGAGARHRKRWRDVEELLLAGINVFTTVRVQDLESLNDVVGGITGMRVTETLPDSVFDAADEVVLVDVPLDELLDRLGDQANLPPSKRAFASLGFARKGNLIALRELALRRMAERVEDDVQAHRVEQSIGPVWKTDTALLACVGPLAGAEHVVRSAARLAGQLNASWHAIYIETPQLRRVSHAQGERVLKTLKLAESLGATTAVLTGNDISKSIVDYARSHNFSKIVLGHSHPSWADVLPWHKERLKRIAVYAPDIDLIEIGRWSDPQWAADGHTSRHFGLSTSGAWGVDMDRVARSGWRKRYLCAAGASIATALIAAPLVPYLEMGNVAMLFLLTVLLVSVRLGQGASVVATVVGALALILLTTRWRFVLGDVQHLLTFMVMLAVGLITGKLTADLRYQSGVATDQAAHARALYEFSRALSGALQTEQIFEITRTFVQRTFGAKATLLLPNGEGALQMPATTHGDDHRAPHLSQGDLDTAQGAYDRATPAGASTDTEPESRFFYLPLMAPMRTRGVLAIDLGDKAWLMVPEQRKQLETFATLAAIALERVHYVEVAQDALVDMESERLRNSLLAAISHDLRTPLTSLVGLSESLALSSPRLHALQLELADTLRDEALRMSDLVTNLLDMARMQSGKVQLDMQWQSLEEVVGSALRARVSMLERHHVVTALDPTLPLARFDAVLIERVLCNLVENACKYTPPDSTITLAAGVQGAVVQVSVSDNGPGVPSGREEAIFDKFTRGERESAKPGVGLGLSICRAIVQAHGGKIEVHAGPAGGAAFVFTLPLGVAPAMPLQDETE